MNRKCILLFRVLLLLHITSCKDTYKDDDEEGGVMETLGLMIDVVNVFAFVLAGGPEEVFARLVFLGMTLLTVVAIAATCRCCFEGRKPTSFERSLEWGSRGVSSCMAGSELYANRSLWGF